MKRIKILNATITAIEEILLEIGERSLHVFTFYIKPHNELKILYEF